jgi:uroporphyrin-III C-methyltransferase/precorrin-2 dehydrogenase/sirohydrochlorin ferrochelatase
LSKNTFLPIFVNIEKKKTVVIGGGNIALAKLENILQYGNNITVIAKDFLDETANLCQNNNIAMLKSAYKIEHLQFGEIIIAATNDYNVNQEIAQDCQNLNKIFNAVDEPKISDFIFGANIKRGNLNIVISSSGISPVLARFIKQKIHRLIPENFTTLNDFIAKNRQKVKNKLTKIQPRRLFWESLLESNFTEEVIVGNYNKAQEILDNFLTKKENKLQSAVYFIGAGPGDPELITLKAIRLLSKADIVLYDRLVAKDILNFARRDALKINVGKRKNCHPYPQEKINKMLLQYAQEGNVIARLKGGDVTIFAHLSEEIQMLAQKQIPFQIIPGVTAASGASSYAGFPLTARNINNTVRFITVYKENLFDKKYWQNLAQTDDVLVFYMSSANLKIIAENLIKFGKKPQTALAVIEQATTIYQNTFVSSLEMAGKDLIDKEKFISPSLIVVGDVVKFHEKYQWLEEGKSGKAF